MFEIIRDFMEILYLTKQEMCYLNEKDVNL